MSAPDRIPAVVCCEPIYSVLLCFSSSADPLDIRFDINFRYGMMSTQFMFIDRLAGST